ncbi:MAG: hypothetical protein M3R52_11535 [Acidobacteriota bacterium]|nr:hypothetical protein [Acidobacteriota bacterium]
MADKQEILKLIEQAARGGRAKLELGDNQLTSLPTRDHQAHQPDQPLPPRQIN